MNAENVQNCFAPERRLRNNKFVNNWMLCQIINRLSVSLIGFHEAIGDVIALSVSTPNHMESIGLLPEGADDPGNVLSGLTPNGSRYVLFSIISVNIQRLANMHAHKQDVSTHPRTHNAIG